MCQTDKHPAVLEFYAAVSRTRRVVSRLELAVAAISDPPVEEKQPEKSRVVQLELKWQPSTIPPKLAVSR